MANTAKNELLHDIATSAHDDIVRALSEIEEDSAAGAGTDIFVECCITHIDNIATAAEMTGVPGLVKLCAELLVGTKKTTPGNRKTMLKLGSLLTDWTAHMQAFADDPSNTDVHEKLVAVVAKTFRPDLLKSLAEVAAPEGIDSTAGNKDSSSPYGAIPDDPESVVTNDSMQDHFDLDGDAASVSTDMTADDGNEIFTILASELIEIRPQLDSALTEVLQNPDASFGAAKYSEIVGRIKTVCASIGMRGLESICDFICRNMESVGQRDAIDRAAVEQSFREWPDYLLDYLANPLDTQVCLNLLAHLQLDTWPDPYSEETVHDLLENLADLPVTAELDGANEARQKEASAEDVEVRYDDDINPALLDAFFHEAPTTATEFNDCLGEISHDADIVPIAEAAQRLTHTLKGSANLVGARGIANLSHHLEDILEYLAKNRLQPPEPLLLTMRESADCIESMIDSLRGIDVAPPDALRILQNVLDWANRIDRGEIDDPSDPIQIEDRNDVIEPQLSAPKKQYIKDSGQPDDRRTTDRRTPGSDILHVPTTAVDKMFRLAGEVSIAIGQVQEHMNRLTNQGRSLREQDNVVQQRRFELENLVGVRSFSGMQRSLQRVSGNEEIFDSLELDQYDEFYTSAHSFIEAVTDSREVALSFQSEIASLDGLFRQHKILNDELQQMIMEARMVPVNTILSRLHRSVRQTCRATDKQASLQVDGAELMMDSEILSRIVDPLTHLLRNAIDHGIEAEAERIAANKSIEGALHVRFYQAGNDMIIECTDDGRGLDKVRIRDAAVNKGYIDANRELNDHELTNMLTQSGFTTRDNVTQISGRGVGLDLVQNTVAALKGTMEVGASDTGGFKVLLRLPLTLISTHALLVRVSNKLFAIPTNSLEQILAPDSGLIRKLGNDVTFEQDNTVYPVRVLGNLLGIGEGVDPTSDQRKPVLITRSGGQTVALVIDQVVNSHDVVVKSLGSYVKEIDDVVGVSILGDGSVVPVLDVPKLLSKSGRNYAEQPLSRSASQSSSEARKGLPSVLIVDDSLSVRTSLAELVSDAGFQAVVARDGLEAIELLRVHSPVVVLADLEMPNMNGLELTSHIRADSRLSHLPVLMITSRTQKKHRDQASAAGVTEYVTKPYNEDDLTDRILSFTAQERAHG